MVSLVAAATTTLVVEVVIVMLTTAMVSIRPLAKTKMGREIAQKFLGSRASPVPLDPLGFEAS